MTQRACGNSVNFLHFVSKYPHLGANGAPHHNILHLRVDFRLDTYFCLYNLHVQQTSPVHRHV
jgi:hypothetical protein